MSEFGKLSEITGETAELVFASPDLMEAGRGRNLKTTRGNAMNNVECDPTGPREGTSRRVAIVFGSTLLVGMLFAAQPVIADDTGIKGKVLRGPVIPGPTTPGESDEVPFRASFHVLDTERVVAKFESAENGLFKVLLAPGEYTIVPDKKAPILFPTRQTKYVRVPEDGFADVVLRFDTGMR